MTDIILSAVTDRLVQAGLPALRAYPASALNRAEPCVCVGLRSCKTSGSGMGEYLGRRVPKDGGEETELYGLRLETEIELNVFAPSAVACTETLDRLSAALDTLPGRLKVRSLVCSRVQPDETAGMFRCDAVLSAAAHLIAESDGESGTFLDFELRGVFKHAD